MEELRSILLKHYSRYPMMEITDFIKLIFQNTFGPQHFSSNPTEERIRFMFLQESKEVVSGNPTPLTENIGGGYYRVSLENLTQNALSVDAMTKMFVESINHCVKFDEESIIVFKERVDTLLKMIKDEQISLSFEDSLEFIKNYYMSGIKPIHHSLAYNQNYHPHYRVIHADFLNRTL